MRRFFYVDRSLGTSLRTGVGAQAVLYMQTFKMTVLLRKSPRNRIYPPLIVIRSVTTNQAAAATQRGPMLGAIAHACVGAGG